MISMKNFIILLMAVQASLLLFGIAMMIQGDIYRGILHVTLNPIGLLINSHTLKKYY